MSAPDEFRDVLSRLAREPDGSWRIDGEPLRGGRTLASAIYDVLYTRKGALRTLRSHASHPAISNLHCDQLRGVFRQALGPEGRGSETTQDGWHFFTLGASGNAKITVPLVRVYWHLAPNGAWRFVRAMTRELAPTGVPARFKVLQNPADYKRADAAVLYAPVDSWPQIAAPVRRAHLDLQRHMRPLRPLFTLDLGHGLALAEDPGEGESFGMRRAGQLADAVLQASAEGPATWAEVEPRLRAMGIRLDAPHLRPESQADYLRAWEAAA